MMTLYYSPGAASLVVHWLLIELGEPHELRLLDFDKREQKSPEYLRLNPNGLIPVLVDEESVGADGAVSAYSRSTASYAAADPAVRLS